MLAMLLVVLTQLPSGMQVNITDYGAIADNATDCSPAFNIAIQALRDLNNGPLNPDSEYRIRVPGAPRQYLTKTPVSISDPGIRIVGDGRDSKIQNNGSGPVFIFGVRDIEYLNGSLLMLADVNYPPRSAVMDGSLTGNGRRTNGDSICGFSGCPFDLGPGNGRYEGVSTFTVDLAFVNNGGFPGGKVEGILWLGDTLRVQVGGGKGQIDLIIKDSVGKIGNATVYIPAAELGGLQRLSWQIEGKKITAWVNKRQAAVTMSGDAWGSGGSGKLGRNRYSMLILGGDSTVTDGRFATQSTVKTPDLTFYGLNFSAYKKYKVKAVNDSIESNEGGLIVNDSYMFGVGDNYKCLATLWGQDIVGDRKIGMFSGTEGFRLSYGHQIQTRQSTTLGGMQGNGLENIDLSVVVPCTPVVQTFGVLHFTARNVGFRGGSQGFSTIPASASYIIQLNDCTFDNRDSNIYGSWSDIRVNSARFSNMPTTAINTWGSSVRVNGAFCSFPTPNARNFAVVYGDLYGGYHSYKNVQIDFEAERFKDCGIYISQFPNLTTTLQVRDVYTGTSVGGIPFVKADSSGNAAPFKVTVRDIDTIAGKPSMLMQTVNRPVTYSEAQNN